MDNNLINRMNKAIKTGNVIKEFARKEVAGEYILQEKDIQRVITECDTDIFTREDINFEIALINNKEYQSLNTEVLTMLDGLKNVEEQQQNLYKEILLNKVQEKDRIYYNIRSEYKVTL